MAQAKVKLMNGSEEAENIVAIATRMLRNFFIEEKGSFHSMVALAREEQPGLCKKDYNALERWGFLDESSTPEHPVLESALRNIVLSAVVGNGSDEKLVSPIADCVRK